jgi:ribonuclease E
LRDLAGLIVIDFIDMDEKRNNRAVERKMSDCLRHDRARIQVGRISHFGLLEMSRQRIRASVLESSTEPCLHCGGTGHVRSVSSVALQLLRSVEETLMKGATHNLTVRTRTEVALYVLNHKRGHLRDLENSFKVAIAIIADAGQQSFVIDHGEQVHTLEAAKALLAAQAAAATQPIPEAEDDDEEFIEDEAEIAIGDEDADADEPAFTQAGDGSEPAAEGDARPRGKRRRRRRGGRGGEPREAVPSGEAAAPSLVSDDMEGGEPARETEDAAEFDGERGATDDAGRRRRRGRRGGRRRGGPEHEEGAVATIADDMGDAAESEAVGAVADLDQPAQRHIEISVPADIPAEPPQAAPVSTAPEPASDAAAEAADAKRRRSTVREKVSFGFVGSETPAAPPSPVEPAPVASVADEPAAAEQTEQQGDQPRRAGWWSRRFGGGA